MIQIYFLLVFYIPLVRGAQKDIVQRNFGYGGQMSVKANQPSVNDAIDFKPPNGFREVPNFGIPTNSEFKWRKMFVNDIGQPFTFDNSKLIYPVMVDKQNLPVVLSPKGEVLAGFCQTLRRPKKFASLNGPFYKGSFDLASIRNKSFTHIPKFHRDDAISLTKLKDFHSKVVGKRLNGVNLGKINKSNKFKVGAINSKLNEVVPPKYVMLSYDRGVKIAKNNVYWPIYINPYFATVALNERNQEIPVAFDNLGVAYTINPGGSKNPGFKTVKGQRINGNVTRKMINKFLDIHGIVNDINRMSSAFPSYHTISRPKQPKQPPQKPATVKSAQPTGKVVVKGVTTKKPKVKSVPHNFGLNSLFNIQRLNLKVMTGMNKNTGGHKVNIASNHVMIPQMGAKLNVNVARYFPIYINVRQEVYSFDDHGKPYQIMFDAKGAPCVVQKNKVILPGYKMVKGQYIFCNPKDVIKVKKIPLTPSLRNQIKNMSPSFPGWHMLFTTPKPNPVKQIPVKAPPTKAPIKKGPPTKAPIAKGSGNIVNSMNPFDEPTPPKKLPKIVITGVKAKSKIPHKKKIFKVQDGTNVPIKKVVSKKVNNTTKFNIRPVKIITPEAEQKPKAKAPIDEEIITTSSTKQPRKKTTTLTTTPGSDVNAKSTIPGTTEPENEEEEETTTEMPLTTAVSDSISTTSSVSTVKRTRRTRKPTTPSTTIEPDYEEETEPSPPTSTIEPTVVTRGTIKTSLTTPGTTSEPAEIEEGERTVHTRTTTTKKTRKQSTTASLTTTTEPEKIEEEGTTALTRRTRKPTTVPTSTKANESPTSTTTEPDYYSEEIEETASTKRFRKTTISDHIDTGESTTAEVPVSEEEQSSTTRRSRTKLATTAKPPSIKPNKDGLGIDWNEIDINAASGLGLISKGLKNKIPPGNVLVPKKGTQIGEEDGYYPIYYSTKDKHLYTYDDNNKRYKVHLDEDEIPFTLKDGIVSPGYTLTNGIPKFGKKTNKENVNVNVNITIIIDEISKLSPKDPSFISIYDKKETEELVDYSFGRGVNLASLDMHKATGMDNINAGKGINVKPGYIMIPHYGINYEGKIHPGYIDKKGNPVMFNDNGREIEIFLTSDGKPVTVNEKGETFYGFIENEDGTPEWGKIGASFAKECIDVEAMLKEIEALGPSSPAYYFIYDSDGPDSIKKPKSANVQKVITLKNNTNVILGSGLNWDNIDKRRAKGLEDINAGFAVDIPEGMVVVPEIAVQLDNENKRYHVVLIDSVGNMGAINDNGEFEPVYVNELGIPATKNGEGRFVPGLKRMGHNVVRGSSDEDFKTVKKDPFTVAQANFDLGEDNIGYYTITKPVPNKGLAISSIDIEFGLGIKWKQFDLENSIGLGK